MVGDGDARAIAYKCSGVDRSSDFVAHCFHGYAGAKSVRDDYLEKAIGAYRSAPSKKDEYFRYLGVALHTIQDAYAHRRRWIWNRAEKRSEWVHDFGRNASPYPRHTVHHDIFNEAHPSCRQQTATSTKAVIRRYLDGID